MSSLYSKTLRSILPYVHSMTGKKSSRFLKELERSQWQGPEEIKRLQWKRLKAMLDHAYQNVPFYHRRFKESGLKPSDITIPSDMLKLPILTKGDIRRGLGGDIRAKNLREDRFVRNSTGGSTGEPLVFFNDKIQMQYRWASTNRNLRWTSYNIGDKIVKIWSATQDLARSATLESRLGNFFWRRRVLSAYHMDKKTMEEYLEILEEYQPHLVVGYSSALVLLSKYMKHEGVEEDVGAVISTAETLFPHHKDLIADRFNCEVFNRYGSREFSTLAHECEAHSDLHMNAENLFIEIVRDDEHVVSGELGEIIVTDLHNFCMPFIRYSIGDMGVAADGTCSCGRGLPLIEKIEGRIHSVLVTESGKFVPGEFFPHLFKDAEGIKKFQVVQEKKRSLLIRMVKGEAYSQEEMDKMLKIVERYFGENTEIAVEFVDEIPESESGKYHFTISKVPLDFRE